VYRYDMTRHVAVAAALLLVRASAAAPLAGDVVDHPFALSFVDGTGIPVLVSASGVGGTGPAALSVRTADGWIHATSVAKVRRSRAALRAVLQTDDAGGRTIALRMRTAGKGVVAVEATFPDGGDEIIGWGAAFASAPDERFYGLGERADAVEHRGARVESYVSDGPWIAADRPIIEAILPPPGFRARDDATYFPVPWLLSSRGYGVLVDGDATVYHALTILTGWPPPPSASLRLVAAPISSS
jgi:hypothetical protein